MLNFGLFRLDFYWFGLFLDFNLLIVHFLSNFYFLILSFFSRDNSKLHNKIKRLFLIAVQHFEVIQKWRPFQRLSKFQFPITWPTCQFPTQSWVGSHLASVISSA